MSNNPQTVKTVNEQIRISLPRKNLFHFAFVAKKRRGDSKGGRYRLVIPVAVPGKIFA